MSINLEESFKTHCNIQKLEINPNQILLVKQLETLKDYPKNFKGIILEGRDCGTVIAPDADIKFFLTANLEVRAKRRHQQLVKKNKNILYENVLYDLKVRDKNDIFIITTLFCYKYCKCSEKIQKISRNFLNSRTSIT